jgi:peptide/nickel transport system ATP-binding protein
MSAAVMERAAPVARIDNLSIAMKRDKTENDVVHNVSLDVGAGEIVGLVGESGSGKSVTAMSLLRLLPRLKTRYADGSKVEVLSRSILELSDEDLRQMRGSEISIIFQEPMTALNPVLRIERQMTEVLERHLGLSHPAALQRAEQLLADVQIHDPKRVLRSYPHELSGGMRQRVIIAMAFSCNPKLIIADEATTALDVTVQAQILHLLQERARQSGTAVLLITHDLAVVSEICDHVYVMYKGQIVESGPTAQVIGAPKHLYTQALLNALPSRAEYPRQRLQSVAHAMGGNPVAVDPATDGKPRARLVDRSGVPIIEARELSISYPRRTSMLGRPTQVHRAVSDVSFKVHAGETLSLVGESGCGKTSLLNALIGMVDYEGEVLLQGLPASQEMRAHSPVQIVFQDPQSSLNPRWPVWRIITEPYAARNKARRAVLRELGADLFRKVGLEPSMVDRLPHEFSGGQRQRIAIARALSVKPKLLLLDEPTSALDVSVQAQVLNLLMDLQDSEQLAYLFVSHDLSVVRHISDRIAILYQGIIVESGDAAEIMANPQHDYTRALLAAAPTFAAIKDESL